MLENPTKEINISGFYYKKEHEEEVEVVELEEEEVEWKVPVTRAAKNCRNYIREIVDNLHLEPNPDKKVIALSIGDPTVYGNLVPAKETIDAVVKTTIDGLNNGYHPSTGAVSAQEAIAKYLSHDGVNVKPNDVILCSGCSSSLDLCINVLADGRRGHNVLMPQICFPLYRTLAECNGIAVRKYNLLPERDFEVDLADLERKIDGKTAAIILNNPSNPCGSVYNKQHLRSILEIAERHKVPVIADEIYEQLVFPGNDFTSTASLKTAVPILICGGLAKRFLVPGWRLGWIVIHDPINALTDVRVGLNRLTERVMGANTLVQAALPGILLNTPQSFHDGLINSLVDTAVVAYDKLNRVKGIRAYKPQGAMYMMLKLENEFFPQFRNGLEFVSKLMEEESVFCLPGEAFGLGGYMRIIITIPRDLMEEACERIGDFCERYYTPKE